MSRARHTKKKSYGGRTDYSTGDGGRADYYTGADSNVRKEADEGSWREDRRKSGGRVKDMGSVKGAKPKARMDKRARGGRTGSDRAPFSSAARVGGRLGVPD